MCYNISHQTNYILRSVSARWQSCFLRTTAYYGGFTKNVTVFMSKNLIAAENVTTPLRQKAGITSLVMLLKTNTPANEVKVHIQDEILQKKSSRY